MAEEITGIFIHHVYFWLTEPNNKTSKKLLMEGLQKLSSVKTIQRFHIGEPANTSRDVIDSSYSLSWILIFKNATDQDSYQTDPIHLRFVEECKHLWNRVVVYDSIDAQ
jgi:hypothetical protein